MLLRPKGSRSLPTYRGRAGAPPTIANARRWRAGCVLALDSARACLSITVLYSPAAKPQSQEPPKGEGAPQAGAGRGRPGERGRAAHDSRPPERRKPEPQGGDSPPARGGARPRRAAGGGGPGGHRGTAGALEAPAKPNSTKRPCFVGDTSPTKHPFCCSFERPFRAG